MLATRNNFGWFPTVFDELFANDFFSRERTASSSPAMNVIENENAYQLQLAAPGVEKKDCKVSLDEEGNLVVEVEKKSENQERENKKYLRREFTYTNFKQRMTLPEDVDAEGISARVENGILNIELPKHKPLPEVSKAKLIEIQ